MKTAQIKPRDFVIDRVYDVAANVNGSFQQDANVVFFGAFDRSDLPDTPQDFTTLDGETDEYVKRLSHFVTRGLSLDNHAQLVIAANGAVLAMNGLARRILGEPDSPYINGLNITHETLSALRQFLKQASQTPGSGERTIKFNTESPDPSFAANFAYCRILEDVSDRWGNPAIHISLSAFTWSSRLVGRIAGALGLTESESEVLTGVLNGHSQKDIAASRNRSLDTIKSQCKSILKKAGCTRMSDLAHHCMSISYVMGMMSQSRPVSSINQ